MIWIQQLGEVMTQLSIPWLIEWIGMYGVGWFHFATTWRAGQVIGPKEESAFRLAICEKSTSSNTPCHHVQLISLIKGLTISCEKDFRIWLIRGFSGTLLGLARQHAKFPINESYGFTNNNQQSVSKIVKKHTTYIGDCLRNCIKEGRSNIIILLPFIKFEGRIGAHHLIACDAESEKRNLQSKVTCHYPQLCRVLCPSSLWALGNQWP